MTKNTRRRVDHKISMALIRAENGWDTVEDLRVMQKDAKAIRESIEIEYDAKCGAGALWLDALLRHADWLFDVQNAIMSSNKTKTKGE